MIPLYKNEILSALLLSPRSTWVFTPDPLHDVTPTEICISSWIRSRDLLVVERMCKSSLITKLKVLIWRHKCSQVVFWDSVLITDQSKVIQAAVVVILSVSVLPTLMFKKQKRCWAESSHTARSHLHTCSSSDHEDDDPDDTLASNQMATKLMIPSSARVGSANEQILC